MGVASLGMLLFFAAPADCSALPAESLAAPQLRRAYAESYRTCSGSAALVAAYSSFLLRQGEFARALEVARAGVRSTGPGSPAWSNRLRLNQGIALYSLARMRESLEVLSQVDSAEADFFKALNYRKLARHREAQTSLFKAWNAGYHDPFLLYSLIEEDRAMGDKQSGVEHFRLLLERYPESAWLHMVLGNAAFALEKDQEARDEYGKAVALNPELPNVNYRLGYLAYQAGEDDAAEKYFREGLKIEPQHSDTWLFLGETLKRRGKTQDAIAYLQRALAMDPESSLAYGALATALTETNQLTAAVDVLERAERKFPNDAAFPALLARLFQRLDRKEDAERAAERAKSLLALKLQQQDLTSKP